VLQSYSPTKTKLLYKHVQQIELPSAMYIVLGESLLCNSINRAN